MKSLKFNSFNCWAVQVAAALPTVMQHGNNVVVLQLWSGSFRFIIRKHGAGAFAGRGRGRKSVTGKGTGNRGRRRGGLQGGGPLALSWQRLCFSLFSPFLFYRLSISEGDEATYQTDKTARSVIYLARTSVTLEQAEESFSVLINLEPLPNMYSGYGGTL